MSTQMTPSRVERQHTLRLVSRNHIASLSNADLDLSIVSLTRRLVAIRSRGGRDSQTPVVTALSDWLDDAGVKVDIIRSQVRKDRNADMGVLAQVGTGEPPYFLLTACLDTADFGAEEEWSFNPLSGHISGDGWLYGRGSGDSKVAVAIFSHILAMLRDKKLNGTLLLLADSDEHTGRFGAVKCIVEKAYKGQICGAYIGYPGINKIKIGARGFYRTSINFYGTAEHTGSRDADADNAIQKAAFFCRHLDSLPMPTEKNPAFSFGPKVTVTSISSRSSSFSIVPDRCRVRVDLRLTPSFQRVNARDLVQRSISATMEQFGGRRPSVRPSSSWPAYQISDSSRLLKALRAACEMELGYTLPEDVSGPSNVGCYLAQQGIEATCGFGVDVSGLHARDERIRLESIAPVFRVYLGAVSNIFGIR